MLFCSHCKSCDTSSIERAIARLGLKRFFPTERSNILVGKTQSNHGTLCCRERKSPSDLYSTVGLSYRIAHSSCNSMIIFCLVKVRTQQWISPENQCDLRMQNTSPGNRKGLSQATPCVLLNSQALFGPDVVLLL